jgi:O-antigen/teichoic acid export membrane protein
LTTKEIRLEYSGFMIFAAKMISVATGLIFQFIVARALSPVSAGDKTEYDLWFNINDITTYFVLMGSVLSFWTMRFVARGKEGAIKTGIVANLIISVIATLIFLPLVPTITSGLNITEKYLPIYFLVSIQIVEMYSISMLESGLQAKIPQTIGYGLIIQQVCKVILGYILIVRFNQLLLGAVITTIIAFALQTVYYFKLLAQELKQKIRWEYVKEWLKGSLANIYNAVGNQIATVVFIMLFDYGGKGARGILGAAATVANVITYSSFLAYALTPKLLAERKQEDITTSLKMVLMFAIPMTIGAVALSDSYITILAPEYTDAAPVLIVLAIDFFVTVVSGLVGSVLFGFETVDEQARISLQELAKSRLFVAFSLPYLHSAITIPTTFFILTNYALNQPLQAALYVSIINASARFAMFLIQYAIVRKMIKIDIPWRSLAKYAFAAAVMGIVLMIIPHMTRISTTLIETAVGGVIYLAVLMTIDEQARRLPKAVMQEIRYRLKKS